MALPLEPETGMFPDTLQEPFVDAPAVRDLAEEVMAEFDEFREVREAVDREEIAIAYVFETKVFKPDEEEFKPHTIAKVMKASPLWRSLTDRDLVIQFRRTFWDLFKPEQRRAVLHHELMHIAIDRDEKGRIKLALRPHQVEDFAQTLRRFGPILPGRREFVKAFQDWQHEQDVPEPTPIRPVEALGATEDHAHALDDLSPAAREGVLRAARKFRDGIPAGMEVTLTTAEGSATAHGKGRTREQNGYQVVPTGCPEPGCALGEGHDGAHLPVQP